MTKTNGSRFTPGLILLCAGFMACASGGTPTSRTETTYIPGASGALTIRTDDGAVSALIDAPMDRLWVMLPSAYDSLGIPISLIDPKKRTMGHEGFKVHAKLGKERLSTYFECGTTQVGPNADSYELYLTVLSTAEAVSTRTRVTTTISAAAKPLQFSQAYSRCSTKGVLEKRLMDAIAKSVK
jgi:hypothetical protein